MAASASGPRVLLLWPGGLFRAGANFGVPQLVSLAGVLRRRANATVAIVDLDMERALGPVDLRQLARPGYDVVGLSCYSSYDYLKVMALGAALRSALPRACLVAGGYHPSAMPSDFVGPGSPFDYVVVGDGERPLLELCEGLARGARPAGPLLGPAPWTTLDDLEPYDWSLLERYRTVARTAASQAEIYLSRGCPHGCSFCMERAKGETAWRAFEPERALEEIHRLDAFVDLSHFTLFIADALFGARPSWRKALLDGLGRRPCRARKVWLLTRADTLDREDLELMARANAAPGFGLESGDPEQLARIRKTSDPTRYLERMAAVATAARELDVPFGVNVIVGHPGETEQSLRRSAAYLQRLLLADPAGTTGFLSVDPFRLYPGSSIAVALTDWQRSTGMQAHRYPWWHDGDQSFLAEWIEPSGELGFRRALALRHELFDPILRAVAQRFAYRGPAQRYFRRAIAEQLELCTPARRLYTLGMWHLWHGLTAAEAAAAAGDPSAPPPAPPSADEPAPWADGLAGDAELAAVARAARRATVAALGTALPAAVAAALEQVPRERFVLPEDVSRSADDCALPLTEDGRSTISALHAYAAAYAALELSPGDWLVDLGAGTGYGSAVAAAVVGRAGRVLSVELDGALARRARRLLAAYPQVEVLHADAHEIERWRDAPKVVVAFALPRLPPTWLAALGAGGVLVAPIGGPAHQTLTRFAKSAAGTVVETALAEVRYVVDRTAQPRR